MSTSDDTGQGTPAQSLGLEYEEMDDSVIAALPRDRLLAMAAAGREVVECYRVLDKVDLNIVGEVLREQGTFYEWDHYPKGDVYDHETHSQYYYHAHRGATGEHGHFHTFVRRDGMPEGVEPVPHEAHEEWPEGDDAIAHLAAISMDSMGYPTHMFTTNRWVTGESWFVANDVIRILDSFRIDHAKPSWPTNRWISAMMALFHPQVALLLRARDKAVADWRPKDTDVDVLEDRDLEVTSIMPISVEDQVAKIEAALRQD